jgi:hypothetical protein
MCLNRILYYAFAITTLTAVVTVFLLGQEAITLLRSPMTGVESYLWFIVAWGIMLIEVVVCLYVIHRAGPAFSDNDWTENAWGFRMNAVIGIGVLLWSELMLLRSAEILV